MKKALAFVLAAMVAAPAFAEDAPLQLVAPQVGDICTYQVKMPQRLGGVANVIQTTVTGVAPDGTVTYERKVLEGGDQNSSEPVGSVTTNVSNRYGWVRRDNTDYTPYVPVLGARLGSSTSVMPGSNLGKATYTRPMGDGNGIQNTSVDGQVSGWEDITVPAGHFKVLRATWNGSFFRDQASYGRDRQVSSLTYSYSLSSETSCVIETRTVSNSGVTLTSTQLVKYEKAGAQPTAAAPK
jgi:hypothetical protein